MVWQEVPLFARIIHLADTIDIIGNNTGSGNNSWNFICQYLLKNRDGLFDSECVNAFFYAFTHSESFICLSDNSFEMKLWEIIPRQKQVFDWKTCKNGKRWITPRIPYLPKPCHNYCMEWQVFCFSVLHLGPFYFKSFGACAISTPNNIRSVLVNLFCNTLFDKYLLVTSLHWC